MQNMDMTNKERQEWQEFFRGLFRVGIPVIIQSLINSLVNMLDVFMVGQLGEADITSASLGNAWFSLFSLLCGGVSAAGSLFIAQYWGKKEVPAIKKYMGIMMVGTITLAFVFAGLSVFGGSRIIRLSSSDGVVIERGGEYVRIIGYSYLFFAVTNVFAASLRSTERAYIPMTATVLSLLCNLCLNYVMIFGHFGVPAMGVYGAAYATLISRIIEMVFLLCAVRVCRAPIAGSLKEYMSWDKEMAAGYFRIGFLIILGEGIYAVGSYVYNMAYKYTGTNAQAALQICNSARGLAMVLAIGVGNCAGVIIGKMLGSNEMEKAKRFCRKYLAFSAVLAAVVSCGLVLLRPVILRNFNIGPEAYESAERMMLVLAFELPFRAVNFTIITGILRCGGDSTWCFVSNLCGTWLFGLPMAFLGAAVLKVPAWVVYLMACADEVGKFFICFPRAVKYRWMHNLTVQNEQRKAVRQ